LPSNHLPAPKQSYTKRLIALGLTITIGFFAISGIALWDSRKRELDQARQAAANVIATIGSDIERNLELYDLSLQAVVDGINLPALPQLSPELRQLLLFDRAATAKDMGSIFVLDKDGIVTIDSRELTPLPENHSHDDYFFVHEASAKVGLYLSRPWTDSNGEDFIAISRRLSNADGSFSGAVVGTLRLTYFRNLFDKVSLGGRDTLVLIRQDGTIVMRTPFLQSTIGYSLASSRIFRRIVSDPTRSFEDTAHLDSVTRLYVSRAVGEYPLFLTYGLSLNTVYAGWYQKVWRIGLLMFVLCATNIALIASLAGALRRRAEAEYQLAITATTDALTGLCNRRRLDEMLDLEWRRAMRTQSPIAVLMIDADSFKEYNDRFGHPAGDAALAAIAHCIQSNTKRASDIAARYGGEEFSVLLPDTSLDGAVTIAERIRASVLLLRADQQGRPDSTPTVSIGAASLVPRQGLEPRDVVKAADAALYLAKNNGRNRTEPAVQMKAEARQSRLPDAA
jgi:diguanylate cyclase (GGDEF)-like protein